MFKKTKGRNFRQRQLSDDEEAGNNIGGVTKNVIREEEEEEKQIKTLLSFDHVEGDDVTTEFKLRKSTESRRLDKLNRKSRAIKQEEGEEEEEWADEAQELTDVKKEKDWSRKEKEKETGSVKVAFKAEQSSNELEEGTRNKFPTTFADIPDARAVYDARKRREKARGGGGTNDSFIPLDDTVKLRDKAEVHSRLVREDENDLSDDEDNGRFYSAKALAQSEEERRRNEQDEFLRIEQGDDDDEDQSDEELARWEREQMRKGVSSQQAQALQQERQFTATMLDNGLGAESFYAMPDERRDPEPMEIEMEMETMEQRQLPRPGGDLSGFVSKAPVKSVGQLIQNIRDRLSLGAETMRREDEDIERLETSFVETSEIIAKMEEEAPIIQRRFMMFQEMRGFVRNLMECLNEKVEELNALENRMGMVMNGRAESVMKRRRQDVQDQFDETSAAAAGKAQSLIRTPENAVRAAEREARRARRRRVRENTLDGLSHEEGLSSDDEQTPSQLVAYEQEIGDIRNLARGLFADAMEEYSSIERVCNRLLEWLALDPVSFNDAYIALCLPKLMSPFIRVQLIDWDPLNNSETIVPLEKMEWYESLLLAGTSSLSLDAENPVLVGLVPSVVEKVILPKLTEIVRDRWDAVSEKQTRNLAFLLDSLVTDYPTLSAETKNVQILLNTIYQKIKTSVADDLFMPMYSKQSVENLATGCRSFLDRQFWTAIKLMRSISLLNGFLHTSMMQELIIDGIINRNLVLALQCCTVSEQATMIKCRAIIALIPSEWFRPGDEEEKDQTKRQLQPLCNVLRRIADEWKTSAKDFARELNKFVNKAQSK